MLSLGMASFTIGCSSGGDKEDEQVSEDMADISEDGEIGEDDPFADGDEGGEEDLADLGEDDLAPELLLGELLLLMPEDLLLLLGELLLNEGEELRL